MCFISSSYSALQLIDLQTCECTETHVKNGAALDVAQVELGPSAARVHHLGVLRFADDADDLIQVVHRNDETF
jgi:hypothetical protein